MITFYRTVDCPQCSLIEDALAEMALAHKVVQGSPLELRDVVPPGTCPPVLVDGGEVFQGSDAILKHLTELEEFRKLWYKYQSDACYCGEDE